MVKISKPKVIVTDVEGTTTSVKFWAETLVPFIKTHSGECLRNRWGAPEVMDVIDRLRKRANDDRSKGVNIPAIMDKNAPKNVIIGSVMENVFVLMALRRYSSPLKQFQLIVWMYGYQTKQLKGHVFSDVSTAFHNWKTKHNIQIYMFSSGLTLAQKLLFTCSVRGNLTPLISDYFDSEIIGPKTNPETFNKIAVILKRSVSDILFLSDNPSETSAAKTAGCQALVVIRPGNNEIPATVLQEFESIKKFLEIKFE